MNRKKELIIRTLFFVIGLCILSLGIAVVVQSDFGMGPWDLVNAGLTNHFGLTFGTWMNIVAITLLLIASLLQKTRPRLTAMITSIVMGVFIDIWLVVVQDMPTSTGGLKLAFFLLGLLIISIGIAIYLVSNLPPSPLDCFMLALKQRLGLSFRTAKITSESIGLVIGVCLGESVGIGTFLIIFVIGPIVQVLLTYSKQVYERILVN
ncbi:MAG: YitT family protein [Bacillaceae bacterium]